MSSIQLPGLIDIHVHLRDPGQTQKEDFTTGTRAALAGGFTMVCDMPNNTRLIDTAEAIKEKIAVASQKVVSDIGFYFGTLGDKLPEFAKSKKQVLGLKIYLNETTGGFFVQPQQLVDIFTAWNDPRPVLLHAEVDVLDRVIAAAKQTGQKIHICHVALAEELKKIIAAKEAGVSITCGVTPHHLFLTEDVVATLGPLAMMKPTLATPADVDFLWQHLDSIDVVESDHAPHTLAEKQSGAPPFGVPGLETTVPLLLTAIHEGKLTQATLTRLLAKGPRRVLGLPDDPTTSVLIDPDAPDVLDNHRLQTKCGWTPFAGRPVRGKVVAVVIRGKKVFDSERVLAAPGSGKIVTI